MAFGTTTKKECTQLLVTVFYIHMLMHFLLDYCKSLGLECQNKVVGPPPGLKGFLSGFPIPPNAHDAASVEQVL